MNEPRWRRYVRFWRQDPGRDVDEELAFHFAERIAQFEAEGATHEEAVAAAGERFGEVPEVRAELLEVERRITWERKLRAWIDAAAQDMRYAVRALRRQPAFVAAIVVTLSLAVGVNLAVMALLDTLYFRPPAGVVDPGSVRRLYSKLPALGPGEPPLAFFSYSEFQAIRSATRDIARVAIDMTTDSVDVEYNGTVNVTGVSYATADLLPLLGAPVERGRVFSEAEDDPSAPAPVAVISRRFADHVFGAAINPLGGEVRVQNRVYRVIGILAPPFAGRGLSEISVWIPFNNQAPLIKWTGVVCPIVVRLLPTVDAHVVEAHATPAYRGAHAWPETLYDGGTILVASLSEARAPGHRSRDEMIVTRLGVVSLLLLLIACANVANLLLARSWTQRRELAVRAALGITRARLATLSFFEAFFLASTAGIISLLVARVTGEMLRTQLFPRVRWAGTVLDTHVLLLGAAIAVVAALFVGLPPALFAARQDLADALKSGARFTTARRGRMRGGLLIVQTALAVVLLVGALLLGKSLGNVRGIDVGYDADHLVIASVYFPDRSPHPEDIPLIRALVARIGDLPGVAGVVSTFGGPLDRVTGYPLYYRLSSAPPNGMQSSIGVGPDYFRLVGTRILKGRSFLPSDTGGSPPVIVIGAGMAKQLWPYGNALGQCLHPITRSHPCYTIIGVAEDIHAFKVVEPDPATLYYFPLEQYPTPVVPRTIIVRAGSAEPNDLADTVRRMLRQAFPSEQVRAEAMTRAVEPEMRSWILGARLFSVFSAFSVLVAIMGVYAMAAFDARQRNREMSVRVALGASSVSIMSLSLRYGTGLVAVGVIVGIGAALAGGRFVESVLYGVSAKDPGSFAGSAIVLLLIAVAANVVSFLGSTRVDPAVVLREE